MSKIATAILTSSEIPVMAGDGAVLYDGFIYVVSRGGAGVSHVVKVNTLDYSYIGADPDRFNGGDGIVAAIGFIWIADSGNGGIWQLDPDDLHTVRWYSGASFSGGGITAVCSDEGYIYFAGSYGSFGKLRISDGSIILKENQRIVNATEYVHTLCEDKEFLYGTIHTLASTGYAFRVRKSDLELAAIVGTGNFTDDIVQDEKYFYVLHDDFTTGISRFSKSMLEETPLYVTGMKLMGDGLALVDGKLISGCGNVWNPQQLWIANQVDFTESRSVDISTGNFKGVNEIIPDRNFIHMSQSRGAASKGIWFSKFNKADIISISDPTPIPIPVQSINEKLFKLKVKAQDLVTSINDIMVGN